MAARRRGRGMVSASATVLGASLLLTASAGGVSARPIFELQQADGQAADAGASPVADVLGSHASISGDGRFVVYQGAPPAAVDGAAPDARSTTIYLSDREAGSTVELTPVPAGLRAGNSVRPAISGDGCSVVTITEMALDVFRDDDLGQRWDVYRSVLPHCDGTLGNWELVSTRTDDGGLARDDVIADQTPAVSRSGTEILFVHPAGNLFEASDVKSVTLVDLSIPLTEPARTQLVAGMPVDRPDTTFVHVGIDQPAISDDGRFVAYASDAASSEAVPRWGSGPVDGGPATKQVFVWDRQDLDPFTAVRLVSALPSGEPSSAGAGEPTLSGDGGVVGFSSTDQGLVSAVFAPCTDACPSQIYRLDRDVDGDDVFDEAGDTRLDLVSAVPDTAPPVAGVAASWQPSLSADGNLLAFASKASNLQLIQAPGGGETDDGDILVADNGVAGLRRVAVSIDGVRPTIGAHARPQLSDTGRVAVFDTLAASQILADGATPGRQVLALAVEPRLSLADADVGTTVVGLESTGWFVGLVNEGPSAFDPASVEIDDSRFSVDVENSSCIVGTIVPAGSSCNVWFTFTPTSEAPVSATLTVSEVGLGAVSVSSRISGAGGEPALQSTPGGADLGSSAVGVSAPEFVFDISNVSLIPTSISDVVVSGAHPGDFVVSTNSCADRPLNPRATCAVTVVFTPTDSGRRTALLEVVTPQGQRTSSILGGDGVFAPQLFPVGNTVQAGEGYVLGGSDYPPSTELTVVFGDGPTDVVKVVTNQDGGFLATVPVAPNERGGQRRIVVKSVTGVAASAPIEVIADQTQMVGVPGFGLGR